MPLLFGAIFILAGILIVLFPQIVTYCIAAMFITIGLALWAGAWGLRSRIEYRRLNGLGGESDGGPAH